MFKRKKKSDLIFEILYLISERSYDINELLYSERVGLLLGYDHSLMVGDIGLEDRIRGNARILKTLYHMLKSGWISPQPRFHDKEITEYEITEEGESFLDQFRKADIVKASVIT